MSRLLAIAIGCISLGPSARAEDVAVITRVHGGEIAAQGVRAVVWHALYDEHGHVAVELDEASTSLEAELRRHHLRSLYTFDVDWEPLVVDLEDRGKVAARAPRIQTTEYLLDGDDLTQLASWTTYGALALYEVDRGAGDSPMVALPLVALQEAMSLAVAPIQVPAWDPGSPVLRIPVVVAADDDYRAFYGPRWSQVAERRVERASAMLRQAGLGLEIVGHEHWESPATVGDLSRLLDILASTSRTRPHALRVGLTQQTSLHQAWGVDTEDVGRAFMPGQDVLIADQAIPPGHLEGWDAAEEGAALAHEILHALGVPHTTDELVLMSATKESTVQRVSMASRELARAAGEARYAHWDAATAMSALDQVASRYIVDTHQQLEFITGNLALGLGVPGPGEVEPGKLSALSNMAMGRYYLRLAAEEPVNAAALRQSALVHSATALEQEPDLVEHREMIELIEAMWSVSPDEPGEAPESAEEPVMPGDPAAPRCGTAYEGTPWFGGSTCSE